MTTKVYNKRSVADVENLLPIYNKEQSETLEPEWQLADILADVMHYCVAKDIEFETVLRRAYSYVDADNADTDDENIVSEVRP